MAGTGCHGLFVDSESKREGDNESSRECVADDFGNFHAGKMCDIRSQRGNGKGETARVRMEKKRGEDAHVKTREQHLRLQFRSEIVRKVEF